MDVTLIAIIVAVIIMALLAVVVFRRKRKNSGSRSGWGRNYGNDWGGSED